MSKNEVTVENTPCPVCNNKINKLNKENDDKNEFTGIYKCVQNHRFKQVGVNIKCIAIPSTEDQSLKDKVFEYDGNQWILKK